MDSTNYETGLWGLSWDDAFGDDGIQGVANLTEDGIRLDIPFGSIFDDTGTMKIGSNKQPLRADYLYGYLRDGKFAVLRNAFSLGSTRSFPGADRQTVSADCMLVGKGRFNPNSRVTSAKIGLYGLRDWVGKLPFSMNFDSESTRYRSTVFDSDNIEKYKSVLLDNQNMKVVVDHSCNASWINVAGQTIKHDCNLLIDFKSDTTLDDVFEVVGSMSTFLSFCTGTYAEVLSAELFLEESTDPISCHALFVKTPKKTELLKEVRFPLSSLENEIGGMLDYWLNPPEDLIEPINILVSLEADTARIPLDMKFLIAAQTLEAISKVEVEMNSIPESDYERYRKILLDSVEDADVKRWISERFPGNTKGQTRLLRELLERNEKNLSWLIPDRKAFLTDHVIARNRYTHRKKTEKALSGKELYWHTEAVKLLCVCLVSFFVGMDEALVISQLKKIGSKQYAIGKIKDMYAVK